MSPQQRRLWQLFSNAPSSANRVIWPIQIDGPIQPQLVSPALQKVVSKYEILRTTLHSAPEFRYPLQAISQDPDVAYQARDLTQLPSPAQKRALQQVLSEAKSSPLDIARAPTIRATFVKLKTDRSLLILAISAYATDFAGMCLLHREIIHTLAQAHGQEPHDASDNAQVLQYAELSEWHNSLGSRETDEMQSCWLRERPTLLDLTHLHNSSARVEQFQPAVCSRLIDKDISTTISPLNFENPMDASASILSCWQVLLWRYTGLPDFTIGLHCDGRTYEELAHAIGPLSKTLPISCQLSKSMNFTSLLESNRHQIEEAFRQQEHFSWETFERTQKNLSHGSYFPVCFGTLEVPQAASYGQLQFTVAEPASHFDRFHLGLFLVRQGPRMQLEMQYNSSLIASASAERILENALHTLRSAVNSPTATLDTLSTISPSERDELLSDFNCTELHTHGAKPVHDFIAEQAAEQPDKIAVVSRDDNLSYRELNLRAEQLASHLREKDLAANTVVALCVERSPDMLVGILGILKAGCAYVPLDPSYPQARLDFMVRDTSTPTIVTQQHLADRFPEHQSKILFIDQLQDTSQTTDNPVPHRSNDLDDLAYVIYTSGSSGTPKGVQITHRNLTHSTTARMAYYQNAPERYLLLSSFSFDSSVAGIFWTLATGGTLVLPSDDMIADPLALRQLIADQKITHMLSLPSIHSLLLNTGDYSNLESLSTVIVAGETCSEELVQQHRRTLPNTRLFNEYGPTEGTVWCTAYDCSSQEYKSQVPIGRPIPGAQVYLLDDQLAPVPLGAIGEIVIGGPGVARGYLNQTQLTSQRFIENRASVLPDTRLYRTGDLGRFLPDGNLVFLGRRDHQVKVRGYRIELEEVEAALRLCSHVQRAVARVWEENTSDHKLIAYVQASETTTLSSTEIRDQLRESLPDYMIPSSFIVMDHLPTMPNGKVDRTALPIPDESRPDLETDYAAPRNELEEVLSGIWTDLLRTQRVGINDNFFDLGGHSILVTQLVARIRDILQVDLSVTTVFQKPTVASLAGMLLHDPKNGASVKKTAELVLRIARIPDEDVTKLISD